MYLIDMWILLDFPCVFFDFAQKNIYVTKLSGADNEPFWFSRKEKDDLLR